MAENPYSSLPDHRFWRKAVTSLPPFALDPIIRTPFKISPQDKVATAGSCFAQEIAMRLQASGFHYYLAEQPPAGMSADEALRRNYSMYSCRYGNLYTTAQLLQLIDRAYGRFTPQLDFWNRPEDGRFVDPFRPRIEPDGAILQLAPGVAGGEWDPNVYEFYNMTVSEVVRDFTAAVDRIREVNPNVRIVLSVSPVGIIATYEDRHVIESNCAVKAILRAAADEVVRARPNIAYLPSYDLATVSPNVPMFYREDTRRINPYGVDRAMRVFFDHFTDRNKEKDAVKAVKIDVAAEAESSSRVVCDEEAIESA